MVLFSTSIVFIILFCLLSFQMKIIIKKNALSCTKDIYRSFVVRLVRRMVTKTDFITEHFMFAMAEIK